MFLPESGNATKQLAFTNSDVISLTSQIMELPRHFKPLATLLIDFSWLPQWRQQALAHASPGEVHWRCKVNERWWRCVHTISGLLIHQAVENVRSGQSNTMLFRSNSTPSSSSRPNVKQQSKLYWILCLSQLHIFVERMNMQGGYRVNLPGIKLSYSNAHFLIILNRQKLTTRPPQFTIRCHILQCFQPTSWEIFQPPTTRTRNT